jgi:hypothetical protein
MRDLSIMSSRPNFRVNQEETGHTFKQEVFDSKLQCRVSVLLSLLSFGVIDERVNRLEDTISNTCGLGRFHEDKRVSVLKRVTKPQMGGNHEKSF